MGYKLSVLIPCHVDHEEKMRKNLGYINDIPGIELRVKLNRGELTKGEYRNELLELAQGEYVAFVDADDRISPDYIETLLKGIETKPDCISLRGEITIDGGAPEIFEHSLKYSKWATTNNPIKYERMPNHLNCIRADIAKSVRFDHINHGEDHLWSKAIYPLLKNEYYTDKILYYYDYISK